MLNTPDKPAFFATPAEFRRWLKTHHAQERELWVGFYKKGSGRPSITWPESVDEALCVGWIDGLRRSRDDESYVIRFTPRKSTSTWSAINIGRMAKLQSDGRVLPAGRKAFAARSEEKSGIYAYEQRDSVRFDRPSREKFQADEAAWRYFQSSAPWYRKTTTWWVVSARKEETRRKRLALLIGHSSRGEAIPHQRRTPKTGSKRRG